MKLAVQAVFKYSKDTDQCKRKCFQIACTPFAVDRYHSVEIQQACRRIWPEYKQLQAQHKFAAQISLSSCDHHIGRNPHR